MKLRFKTQDYQTAAVEAVADCFQGQPPASPAARYRIDPGKSPNGTERMAMDGFKNADLYLSHTQLLDNIRAVQQRQNLQVSKDLAKGKIADINLDVEMETGTGKTYCYIKTMFELNRRYGWSKFIIIVPSIAIREGVYKTLSITAEHFQEHYRKRARFFIYNSRQLHQLESFSFDAGINIMVINVQAFNATGKDNRRIYEEQDDFQSRRPIDVISANRPILILDEPQKMEGGKTLDSLAHFNPLMVLRYSATHKTTHNKIYRLDALDAYNQKLVKKIVVRGIALRGLSGTAGYLYLQSIAVSSNKPPQARIEFEQKLKSGTIRRTVRKLGKGANLFELSNRLEQYRHGHVICDINANTNTVSFVNGTELEAGDVTGDVTEDTLRRIQIREAICAHFDKEQELFHKGIKVLSLFFIDEVARYRDYSAADEKGEYARVFEEEYAQYLDEAMEQAGADYKRYLQSIAADKTHSGYFSIDKKSRRLTNPKVKTKARGENAVQSDDVEAYDLILKDKERLLSLDEPVRFIFSHSALREGWDNPNVFVICILKHSDNSISRRQEVGRGLRLAVNQHGERMDHPATVHEINVLTVVASESYQTFVAGLQKDISDALSSRPRKASEGYFAGKVFKMDDGDVAVTKQWAKQIYRYLLKNEYVNDEDEIAAHYNSDKDSGTLAVLPDGLQPYTQQVFELIDGLFNPHQNHNTGDGRKARKNLLNSNFDKREFKALWNRINHKAVYTVAFDSGELIDKAVEKLNQSLHISALQYHIQSGEQMQEISYDGVREGSAFNLTETQTHTERKSIHSQVKYDLIGKLTEGTQLTRKAVAAILERMDTAVFAQFKINPERFISETIRLINEQKATAIIEHLTYDLLDDRFEQDIFTAGQMDISKAGDKLKRHIYDYVLTDSNVEREFARHLDAATEVVVYAKLPGGFSIPTPMDDYTPDWAIAFKEGSIKHIYFVAETKGSMSSLQLSPIAEGKIACARKFFEALNTHYAPENVKYDVVTDFGKLMEIVCP